MRSVFGPVNGPMGAYGLSSFQVLEEVLQAFEVSACPICTYDEYVIILRNM